MPIKLSSIFLLNNQHFGWRPSTVLQLKFNAQQYSRQAAWRAFSYLGKTLSRAKMLNLHLCSDALSSCAPSTCLYVWTVCRSQRRGTLGDLNAWKHSKPSFCALCGFFLFSNNYYLFLSIWALTLCLYLRIFGRNSQCTNQKFWQICIINVILVLIIFFNLQKSNSKHKSPFTELFCIICHTPCFRKLLAWIFNQI